MNLFIALISIGFLIQLAAIVYSIVSRLKSKNYAYLTPLLVVFFGSLLIFLVGCLFAFGNFNYGLDDFLIVYSIASSFEIMALFFVFSLEHSKLFFVFGLLLFASIFVLFFSSFLVLLFVCYLVGLIFMISLWARHLIDKKIFFWGALHMVFSLIFTILLFFRIGSIFFYGGISSLLFGIFLFFLFGQPLKNGVAAKPEKKRGSFLVFLRYFVFILVVTNLSLLGAIGLHEAGHAGVARFLGCSYSITFYEEEVGYPHTDAFCPSTEHISLLEISGFIAVTLFSILLFLIGGSLLREISLLLMGFNLIASTRDFFALGLSEILVFCSLFAGLLFLFFGVIFLGKYSLSEQ